LRTQKRINQKKGKLRLDLILTLTMILIIVSILFFNNSKSPELIVISHRGASGEEIEHSYAAYDLAIGYGSKHIEQDVVSSKDGTLYVSHDDNSNRLTSVDKNYADMTDEEISKLKTANGENIHSLEDVFKRYDDTTNYVIETKQDNQVPELVRLIKKYDLEKKVIIQSFNLQDLVDARKDLKQSEYMYLADNKDKSNYSEVLNMEGIDIICLNKKNMNAETISEIHNHNKKAFFYTVDTVEDMKIAKELEVDGLFTNYTAKGLYVFGK